MIKKKILVTPEVEVVEYGTLPRSERKTKRVFDNREDKRKKLVDGQRFIRMALKRMYFQKADDGEKGLLCGEAPT